jgi:hypothetical protein
VSVAATAARFQLGILAVGLMIARTGFAQEEPKLDTPAQQEAPNAYASK